MTLPTQYPSTNPTPEHNSVVAARLIVQKQMAEARYNELVRALGMVPGRESHEDVLAVCGVLLELLRASE